MASSASLAAVLAALASTGFTFMVLELLFLRELQITLGGTLYASSATLASVMLGLFLGSQLFGRLSRRGSAAGQAALLIRMELALAVAAATILPALRGVGGIESWPLRYGLSFAVVLVPSVLAGGEIPVALQLLEPRIPKGETGFHAGLVYGADTLGALVGALLLPFVLLPWLGAWRCALAAGAVNVAGALLLLKFVAGSAGHACGAGAVAAAALLVAGFTPSWAALDLKTAAWALRERVPGLSLGYLEDSPYQRIQFLGEMAGVASDARPRVLLLDGVVQASVPFFPQYRETALLGLVSHPAPERVLVIGCGDGDMVAALLSDPRVRSLEHVELDPAVVRAARRYLSPGAEVGGRAAWDDARVTLRLGDGRQFLRLSTEPFDVILADLPHAGGEAAAAFYSAEFFRLARARLKPGGLFMTHVYRSDESEPGGRERLVAALRIAGRTAREAFPEVRLLSPWLDPAAPPDAWPAHWLFASDSPLGAEAAAEGRIAALVPRPRWLTPGACRAAWRSALRAPQDAAWPVSTDDLPAILFPDRWVQH